MLNSKRFQNSSVSQITIAAPGAGRYNLLKSLSAYSDATASIIVASPSVTTVVWAGLAPKAGNLVIPFPEDGEPKGADNGKLYVSCSAGTYRMSVTGVVVP